MFFQSQFLEWEFLSECACCRSLPTCIYLLPYAVAHQPQIYVQFNNIDHSVMILIKESKVNALKNDELYFVM